MNRRHALFFVWFFLCASAYGACELLGMPFFTKVIATLIVAGIVGEVIVCLTLRRYWRKKKMTVPAKALHFVIASLIDGVFVLISLAWCIRLYLHGRPLGVVGAIIILVLVILWQIKETMVGAKYFVDPPSGSSPRS